MKLNGFFELLEKFAPVSISNEFVKLIDGYDNSGIIAPICEDLTGVVFTLDLTNKSVETAIESGANLIVTHHPAIYSPIKRLDGALLKCLNNKIGVISMHLNLDCAVEGIDYHLAKGLGAKSQDILYKLNGGCGYGRIFDLNCTALDVKNKYQSVFETDKAMLFGNQNKKIKKIASFCGSGLDVSEIELASDADIYVSSDIKHHVILHAVEKGSCVLCVSHYSSEVYGFKAFYNKIKEQLNGLNCIFCESEDMM